MTNGTNLTSPSSTSHIYVAIYHHHLYLVWCVSYVYVELVLYGRACSANDHFLSRGKLLINKLLLQGFQQLHLKAAFAYYMAVKQSSLSIQSVIESNDVRHVSRQVLRLFNTPILTTAGSDYPF